MKSLYLLIHSLSRKEITIVRNTLQYLYSRPHFAGSNTIDLFEILLRRKKLPNADLISSRFFNKPYDNALEKLCSRLRNKILDILISEANIENHPFEQLDFFAIKIRKKLVQFYQLLFTKGNGDPTAHSLLSEIITLSKKYESYSPLIEALRASKYFKGFINGVMEHKKVDEQIIHYEYCSHRVNKAIDFYYKLITNEEYQGSVNKNHTQLYLKNAIKELKGDYIKTQSAIINYYLNILQLFYFINEANYNKSLKICNELFDILNENKSVYRINRKAFVFGNLAQCDIYLGNFSSAIDNAQNAQKLISQKSINFFISKEVEFHALFYDKRTKESKILIEEIIQKNDNGSDEFRLAKYQFFYANVFFQHGNYKKALNILNKNTELSKDKPGWDISLRILKIMCMIELEQHDQVLLQIESLRKHIKRHSLLETGKRNAVILKILNALERKEFDFKNPLIREKVNLLAGDDKRYCWEYMTPELIPFHEWFLSKVK
ncbi:MAG: hypothetical protein M3Q58_02715 [Bacteroidota bacterium]|nr:hypothetical protein [Bacteroidota bacterium]